ncbi:MAG TPA: tetratricopeptide repeat protein, partial [Marmoricola sp.]|nr:tetratricopeptide repeat protein [Marmoricola sp.]
MSRSRQPWLARLRYAYADTLVEADDLESALTWFHRTEAVDTQEITDAAQRAAEVEAALQASI